MFLRKVLRILLFGFITLDFNLGLVFSMDHMNELSSSEDSPSRRGRVSNPRVSTSMTISSTLQDEAEAGADSSVSLHYIPNADVFYTLRSTLPEDQTRSGESLRQSVDIPIPTDLSLDSNGHLINQNTQKTSLDLDSYLGELMRVSTRPIPPSQLEKLKSFNCSRNASNLYLNISDDTKTFLRIQWKLNTKRGWKKYQKDMFYFVAGKSIFRKRNAFYELFFIFPPSSDETLQWWNVFPLTVLQAYTISSQYVLDF